MRSYRMHISDVGYLELSTNAHIEKEQLQRHIGAKGLPIRRDWASAAAIEILFEIPE